MKVIYTSDLLSKSEIKKELDTFIKFPLVIDKPRLIFDKKLVYNKTSLGFATEILFELFFSNTKTSFLSPLKEYEMHLMKTLHECKKDGYVNIDNHYVCPKRSNILILYNITNSLNDARLIKVENPIKLRDLINDYYNALETLKAKDCFENNIEQSMFSILILANIIPLCKRFHIFNDNYKNIDENTLELLKKIYQNLPKNLIATKNDIISEQAIRICGTSGRPDFVIGNTLLEIKTTQTYLTKDDIRQIALYYLALESENSQNSNKCIEELVIYYSLYGKAVRFKPEELFNLDRKAAIIKKLSKF